MGSKDSLNVGLPPLVILALERHSVLLRFSASWAVLQVLNCSLVRPQQNSMESRERRKSNKDRHRDDAACKNFYRFFRCKRIITSEIQEGLDALWYQTD